MWIQNYDPRGSWPVSTLLAALPVLTLLGLLVSGKVSAGKSALAGLTLACVMAWGAFGMPLPMVLASAGVGMVFALFRIVWLIVAAVFLYDLAVATGQFEVMKRTIAGLSPDRRLQAVLVAFSFGAFIEGCAGFGAPVAISAAFLVGLGFHPFQSALLCLIANTAPVAWGSVGIPLRTLSVVTELDVEALSATAGRILPILSLLIPFWLVSVVAGLRATFAVWPPLLVIGGAFAAVQFLWSNYVGFELVDIASSVASMIAGVVVLHVWKPRDVWRFEHDGDDDGSRGGRPADGQVALSPRTIARAWMPFALLTVMVLIWGLPAIKSLGTTATKDWLDARWSWKPEVPVLHLQVAKGRAVTGRATPAPADLEKAVLDVVPLSATGTAVFAAAVLSGLLLGVSPGSQARILAKTVVRMIPAIFAILCMLALGFVTKYSGMDAVLGLAFTRTGPLLYPIFGTLLGWLGVALTGSDTSSNVLFGNLQKITATKLGLDPILMAAANSTGGVMGKMIDAQSIVVAAAATGEDGREGEILRAVLRHSIALVLMVGAIVWIYAHVTPWVVVAPR
ncbi:L-lactate permease [Paludisphaera borealis]|uniref:L-lactate permease n=1 Tax=Paludisphaera borealis TaxID=1387353 RepID=A0A1U7CTM5_9BACT|nr:L-lactate permease [Paludisphaera borealis]APW62297.1 L-lactate permease [Paludisphaera borealis]